VGRRWDCQHINSLNNGLAVGTMESEQGHSGKKAHRRHESLDSVSKAPDVRYSVTHLRRNDDMRYMNPASHVICGQGREAGAGFARIVQRR
jgi:hypothetical protein